MDYTIEFPRPYLCRKNASQKAIIDKRLNDELKRIRLLVKVKKDKVTAQLNAELLDEIKKPSDSTVVQNINVVSVKGNKKDALVNVNEKTGTVKELVVSSKKTTKNLLNVQKVNSDTLTNNPFGTMTIGYNCTINFVSTLDFEPFSGSFDTTKWYVVFEKSGGQYFIEEAYEIGQKTIDKPFLKSLIHCKWTMDFNMYASTTYPTTKFKVVVIEYQNGVEADIIWSDVLTVNFFGAHCINISNMGLNASNLDGGYPSIKGGDHGTEPTLYINLNSPAPPDGQTIYLEITGVSSVSPSAWINEGYGQVTIAPGQTHGEWDGVVGSKGVRTTKDVHVKATVNGVAGVSTLRITKK